MGAQQSTGAGASVRVALDGAAYQPGEDVSGTIYVRVYDPMGVDVREIKLRVEGKERVHFTTEEEESYKERNATTGMDEVKHRTVLRHHRSHKTFFNIDVACPNLASSAVSFKFGSFSGAIKSSRIPAGDYSIPFTFNLPRNLPGTVRFGTNDVCKWAHNGRIAEGETSYSVKAVMERPGMLTSNLTDVTELHVVEKPAYVAGATAQILAPVYKFWCCFKEGEADIFMVSEKNAYTTGEKMVVGMRIKNNSPREIPKLRGRLIRTVKMTDPLSGTRFVESEVVSEAKVPGCGPDCETEGKFEMPLSWKGGRLPTTLGHNVQVTYHLETAGETGMCRMDARCDLPVVIYSDVQTGCVNKPSAPADWNPVVFEAPQFACVGAVPVVAPSAAFQAFYADYNPATAAQQAMCGLTVTANHLAATASCAHVRASGAPNVSININAGGNPQQPPMMQPQQPSMMQPQQPPMMQPQQPPMMQPQQPMMQPQQPMMQPQPPMMQPQQPPMMQPQQPMMQPQQPMMQPQQPMMQPQQPMMQAQQHMMHPQSMAPPQTAANMTTTAPPMHRQNNRF